MIRTFFAIISAIGEIIYHFPFAAVPNTMAPTELRPLANGGDFQPNGCYDRHAAGSALDIHFRVGLGMSIELTYPGVYVEELPSGVHAITGVATSIAAFIGWAPKGPVDRAVLVESWSEY